MLQSSKKLAQALCLGLATFGFASTAVAASSGSQLVRPEPISLKNSGTQQVVPSYQNNPGAPVRVVNAGKAARSEDGKTGGTAKTAEKKTKKSKRVVSRSKASVKKRADYSALIRKVAKKHGVPLGIAQAVVQVESNFNPRARGSAGEVGLMQIKPTTARGLGYRGSTKSLYDPETNLEWGMRYLAGAHQRSGGDVCGTILRYNAGHYAKRMNPVSARYCKKVKTILAHS